MVQSSSGETIGYFFFISFPQNNLHDLVAVMNIVIKVLGRVITTLNMAMIYSL